MPSKPVEVFIEELWGVVKESGKDLFDEEQTKAAVRSLVEYAARAQFVIHTSAEPAVVELAKREFEHRTAHVEAYLPVLALDATKRSRLVGILEGVFQLLLKFGLALL